MSPRTNTDNVLPQPNGHLLALIRDGHRIDVLLPKASREDHIRLKTRIQAGQKLCNDYQLIGTCLSGDNCQYNHNSLPPELINVLRHLASEIPCSRKGGCRRETCYKGHVCVKAGCRNCKLGYKAHGVDSTLAEWVQPDDVRDQEDQEESRASVDEVDGVSLDSPVKSQQSSSPLSSFEVFVAEKA